MAFSLPKLPYLFDALEPHIDAKTMEIHHDKHHAGYVNNLNKALEGNEKLLGMTVEDLLKNIDSVSQDVRQTVINNAGGHANHSLFWTVMSPKSTKPAGDLRDVIEKELGGLEKLIAEFTTKAMSVFGSGWVFLTVTSGNKLKIKRHSFQNTPLMHGSTPILGLDVWEHAYYLKYQNLRADYIEAWWNIVNWGEVASRFDKLSK